jgi:hypothetical protein
MNEAQKKRKGKAQKEEQKIDKTNNPQRGTK